MPIYAYRCSACGHAKDVLQKMSDPPLSVCPACGSPSFSKQLTAAGFQLKGSGWYVTDFRGGSGAGKKADAPADGKSDAKPGEGTGGGKDDGGTGGSGGSGGSGDKGGGDGPAPAPSSGSAASAAAGCGGACACH